MVPRRPITPLRGHAAAVALTKAIAELGVGGVTSGQLEAARLYAGRVLEADDRHGAAHELIVQGDAALWPSIDGLVDLALYGRLAHRHLAHHGGAGEGCQLCQQADAMWHNALIEPLTRRRRRTATAMHDQIRLAVRRDIAGFGS